MDGSNTWTEIPELSALTREYTAESLVPGQAYKFRIKATNLVGTSDWSDETAAMHPGVAPTRPGAITFTGTTRTTIAFAFEGLTGYDTGGTDTAPVPLSYHIHISKSADGGYELLTTTTAVAPQTAAYLQPGHTYYFKYQAENSIGLLSEFSSSYWMMPGNVPSAPATAPKLII